MTNSFSHRSARSAPAVVLLCFLIIAESSVAHALLFRSHLILAALLSLAGMWAVAWLLLDYRALGLIQTTIADQTINLSVGRRATASIPLRLVAEATSPSWQEIESALALGGLNLTKPAEPNVLLIFSEPISIHLLGGLRRNSRALMLTFDEPEAVLRAISDGHSSEVKSDAT